MVDRYRELADQLRELVVFQVSTHALVLLDPTGIIVDWLAGAERLFGYRAEEVIGRNASLLFTPEDLAKDLSASEQKTADSSGESEDDRWQVRKDGGRIWVSGTLTALRNAQGELLGFAKIMRNRTDQKSQLDTYESRVVAYRQSEKRKNAFISTLAHELRNPLSSLANAVHLLEHVNASSTSDLGLAIGVVRRQLEFMKVMVDDLLEVARTAAGKVHLRKEPLVLQEIIEQSVETCSRSIDSRTHVVQKLMPDVPIELNADSIRLRQVFVNLIENASKYTQYGGTIWVKVTVEGDEAVVRVQDNGIGIAPETMPYIFDLFTQAEFATRSQGGLGIGLAVVKDNVTLHGGSVQAVSDGIGKGSEFTVRLPLHSGSSPAGPEAA